MPFDQKKTMDRLAKVTQKLAKMSIKENPWSTLQNMRELLDDEFWQEMQNLQQLGMNMCWQSVSDMEKASAGDEGETMEEQIVPAAQEMEIGPLIDIYRTRGKIIVHCALPGLDRNSVKATLRDGMILTIEGQVKENHFAENKEYVIKQERFFGKFIRQIRLPGNVTAKGATSSYQDGVLELVFPRTAAATERQVMLPLSL